MVRLTTRARGYAGAVTRALRTTLATVAAALACWCVPAPAAQAAPAASSIASAIDCPALDLANADAVRDHADAVSDVFAGTVRDVVPVKRTRGGGKNDQGGGAPSQKPEARVTSFEHAVVVEKDFRGALRPGDRIKVVTEPTADEGVGRLEQDEMYLFFADAEQRMRAYLVAPCKGTQLLQGGLGARLRNFLEATLSEEPDDPAPSYSLSEPEDGARSTPALGRLAAPGAAVALIGVLGLFVIARINARRG